MSAKTGEKVRNVVKGQTVTVKRIEGRRVEVLGCDGLREWFDVADFAVTHRPLHCAV